jgi:hypothetical protein
MAAMPFVDRASWEDAARLIQIYGHDAGFEAASLANQSRDVGNVRHFCRWRQIERLIVTLSRETVEGSRH